jgi:flotillin
MTQLRKVVPTNEAHVVQTAKRSISYGRNVDGGKNGNVYTAWPAWVPVLGISVQRLPLSIFDLQLNDYKAYDSGKVPFQVDITAFFVISEPETAAQKVESISELRNQLNETLK